MEKVVLAADNRLDSLHRTKGRASPRHALRLSTDHETVATVNRLAEEGLVESTGFVQRTGGNGMLRVCMTGKGWVEFRGLRGL